MYGNNTTISTPEKLFFNVPNDPALSKKWCNLMKREDKTPLSCRSTLHCCEDNFDIESDMENYVKYRLVGGRLVLKQGVLPHKFDCQKEKKTVERPGYEKRRRIEYYTNLLSPEVNHENLQPQPVEYMECGNNTEHDTDPLNISEQICNLESPKHSKLCHKAIQANIKTKVDNKATNTGFNPKNKVKLHKTQSPVPLSYDSSNDFDSSSSFHDHQSSTEDSRDSDIQEMDTAIYQKHMLTGTLMSVSREPKLLLDVPKASYSCLQFLCKHINKPHVDILIHLKEFDQMNQINYLELEWKKIARLIVLDKYVQSYRPLGGK